MSRGNPDAVRAQYIAWAAKHGGHAAMSRRLGGDPSDEALRQFANKAVRSPRYLDRLLREMEGRSEAPPDLAEEAREALRLIRQGEERLARVVALLPDPVPIARQTAKEALAETDEADESLRPRTGPAGSHTAGPPGSSRTRGTQRGPRRTP